MTSICPLKLWLWDVGKNGYIILCYFGACIMSGFEVIEGWEWRGGGGLGSLELPQVDLTRVSKQASGRFVSREWN